MTTTMTETVTQDHTVIENDEHGEQRFTHIINRETEDSEKYPTTEAYIMAAMVEGFPIEALCGKRWIPGRDIKKYPVCQKCIDEAMRIQNEVFGS